MSLQDPISDMLTRIRNGLRAHKPSVSMPASNTKVAIAKLLKDEGYITDYSVSGEGAAKSLDVDLKYFQGEPVIVELDRYSKPSCRMYFKCADLPRVKDGLGVAVVSTSKGLLTDKQARAEGVGGEILCTVF